MKLTRRLQTAGAIVFLAAATLIASAPQRRGATQTPPNYDVTKEVTVSGTVDDVKTIQGPGGQGGIHVMLKTAAGTLEVDLGPEWFMAQQKYMLGNGDAVSVVGARVKIGSAETIVAREVKKGDQTMTFRDAKGFPKWSGRGRG